MEVKLTSRIPSGSAEATLGEIRGCVRVVSSVGDQMLKVVLSKHVLITWFLEEFGYRVLVEDLVFLPSICEN